MPVKSVIVKVRQSILECPKCQSEMTYTGKVHESFRNPEYYHKCDNPGCNHYEWEPFMYPTPCYRRVEDV